MTKPYIYGLIAIFLFTVFLSNPTEPKTTPTELLDDEEYLEEELIENDEIQIENQKLIATAAEALLPPQVTSTSITTELFQVIRVIDGDTININYHGKNENVRLVGIDTPETVHPSKPVQCFGQEASKKTKEWLEGKKVRIEIDPGEGERDKYRRLLGYIHREDGLFINLELVKQGYAYEYTYNQPYLYQKEFKSAQLEAQTAKRGLWADGVCD